MSGTKGMRHSKNLRQNSNKRATQAMWEIIRVNDRVSTELMLRYLHATGFDVTENYVRKQLRRLERHGYLKPAPAQPGERPAARSYMAVPSRMQCSYEPEFCSDCGQPLRAKICAARPHLAPERDRLWLAMRTLKTFTSADIEQAAGASQSGTRKWLGELLTHGYVERLTEPRPGAYAQYHLIDGADEHHPLKCSRCGQPLRSTSCGAQRERETQRDKAARSRELLWQAMRVLPAWTVAEIRQRSGASERTTRLLVKALARHGYIEAAGAINPEGAAIYRLTQSVGCHLPAACARCGQPLSAASCTTHKERKTETSPSYSAEVRHAAL